jgi:hypothetical protein
MSPVVELVPLKVSGEFSIHSRRLRDELVTFKLNSLMDVCPSADCYF